MNVPTIIVTGPVGVGKSTVAEAMGYQLIAAEGLLQTDRVYSALILVGIIAVLLTTLAKMLENRILKWRPPVSV